MQQTYECGFALPHAHTQLKLSEKALNKAKHNVKELEDEINALHQKILDVGGVRLKAQKAKVCAACARPVCLSLCVSLNTY